LVVFEKHRFGFAHSALVAAAVWLLWLFISLLSFVFYFVVSSHWAVPQL
jgi:hypothetical protein